MLTHAPILQIADPEKEFLVCTYVYKIGLCGVLRQDRKVVCYESWKLNEHEKNYLAHDPELAMIIHALKMWKKYILCRRFMLMSDQIGLRYLFDQSNQNARQARCLAMISNFDFEIRYIKGKENRVADVLSR